MFKYYKTYGFFGIYKLFISLIYTKIFYPQARLIRLPFDIRNNSQINIGENFTTGFGCRIEAINSKFNNNNDIIKIGKNVQINDYVHIGAAESLIIEDNVLIASRVFITDHNHGSYNNILQDTPYSIPIERRIVSFPTKIEENVWIGESATILPGVTIGKGSIIGANSVVTKNIPPNSIAVGIPAKVIKTFNEEFKIWK